MAESPFDKFIKALKSAVATSGTAIGFQDVLSRCPSTGEPSMDTAIDIACLIPGVLSDVTRLGLSYGVLLEGAHLDGFDRVVIEHLLGICSRIPLTTQALYRPYVQRLEVREFQRSVRFQIRVYRPGCFPTPNES